MGSYDNRLPLNPTSVYNSFWWFAYERQAIFHRRAQGLPPPWTVDPILAKYKFTNAYRAADRVSQYLIRNVIYLHGQPGAEDPALHTPREVFFRTMLFKLFNRIDTWEWLQVELDQITEYDLLRGHCHAVIGALVRNKAAVYSPAYMVPSPPESTGYAQKWEAHLGILTQMMNDYLPERLAECGSMKAAFELLRSYPMIGKGFAYQFAHGLWPTATRSNWSEMEFVMSGAGGGGR